MARLRDALVFPVAGFLTVAAGGMAIAATPTLHVFWQTSSSRYMTEEQVTNFFARVGSEIGANIQLHWAPGDPAVQAALLINTGTPLDVALYTHPDMVYNGMLEPLDPYLRAETTSLLDRYLTPVIRASEWFYRGTLYALPTSRNHFVLYWNTQMFGDAGLPSPPADWGTNPEWTWQTAANWARRLTRDTNGDGVPEQFGFSGLGWPVIWPGFFGTDFADEGGRPTINTPAMRRAMEFMVDFANQPFYGGTPVGEWRPNGVFEGKAAMGIGGTWEYVTALKSSLPLDLAPIPMGTQHATISFVDGMGIFKASKNKELAWRFLKYMASEKATAEFFVDGSGWMPAQRSSWRVFRDHMRAQLGPGVTDKHITIMFNAGNYGYIPLAFKHVEWRRAGWYDRVMEPLLRDVVTRKMAVATWLEETQRVMEALLAKSP